MSTLDEYLGTVDSVSNDIDDAITLSLGLGAVLDLSESYFGLPGEIADVLDGTKDNLTIPSSIVSVLGVLPYGIGTAIKTLDDISDATTDVIQAQVDAMRALEAAWKPFETAADLAGDANDGVEAQLSAHATAHAARETEAGHIAANLAGSDFYEGSKLASRMAAYNDDYTDWKQLLTGAMDEARASLQALEGALDTLGDVMPDLGDLEAVTKEIEGIFGPVRDFFVDLEDALCVTITIIPEVCFLGVCTPAVTIDICEILSDIASQVSIVVDFVEGIIFGLLDDLGFDVFGAIEGLADDLLGPLQPIFDELNSLEARATALADAFLSQIPAVDVAFGNVLELFDQFLDGDSLFENRIDFTDIPLGIEISGTALEDGIFAGAGNDTITAEGDGDFLFGGEGDDSLLGGSGKGHEIYGGDGDDTLVASGSAELLDGGAGNDSLDSDSGKDTLLGGDGDDLLASGGSSDLAKGGAGDDTVDGGQGADTVKGNDGEDSLFGREGGDFLYGGNQDDSIEGNAGSDTIDGGAHDDTINGGQGADEITGGAGRDQVDGKDGADLIDGGDGDDILNGNAGADVASGGAGDDRINGGINFDLLAGDDGADTIDGKDGGDTIEGGGGDDVLGGNAGNDWLDGGGDADDVAGGQGADTVAGGAGNDTVGGGDGADIVLGDGGADELFGGNGSDTVDGGNGNDTLAGGKGADSFVYAAGHDVISDFQNDIDTIFFDAALWGGGSRSAAEILGDAGIVGGDALFDFGGNSLTVLGAGDLSKLEDDIGLA